MGFNGIYDDIPSETNIAIEAMAIESSLSFPLKMVDLSIVLWMFTRGYLCQQRYHKSVIKSYKSHEIPIFLWFFHVFPMIFPMAPPMVPRLAPVTEAINDARAAAAGRRLMEVEQPEGGANGCRCVFPKISIGDTGWGPPVISWFINHDKTPIN